jgi:hypothetical protein
VNSWEDPEKEDKERRESKKYGMNNILQSVNVLTLPITSISIST